MTDTELIDLHHLYMKHVDQLQTDVVKLYIEFCRWEYRESNLEKLFERDWNCEHIANILLNNDLEKLVQLRTEYHDMIQDHFVKKISQ